MKLKCMVILSALLLTLIVPIRGHVLAQTPIANDGTTLRQIIVFGRHSIRAPLQTPDQLAAFAVSAYPPFQVGSGCLTAAGTAAETLLGNYFASYLSQEQLLTGDPATDISYSYFRSNSIERSWQTAVAFATGLISSSAPVRSYLMGKADPVFDPIGAGVFEFGANEANLAAAQVQEIYNAEEGTGTATALQSAISGEYNLIRSVLFNLSPPPLGDPPPSLPPNSYCPASSQTPCVDPTAYPITLTANTGQLSTGSVINGGGLNSVIATTDPFVMQYADAQDIESNDVAWNRLTLDQLSQQTRLNVLAFDIVMKSPYLDQVQSSNAASHILRTMQQVVNGVNLRGAFGDARSRTVVVISSDTFVAGLAGLLNVHWQLPGYQPDFCAPGGALVFELRQVNRTKQYIVRVYYTAQTFEQLRGLTTLTLNQPPATMQLMVPGGSNSATNLDVDFGVFQRLMKNAIGQQYVQPFSQEDPPGYLTGVTCPNN